MCIRDRHGGERNAQQHARHAHQLSADADGEQDPHPRQTDRMTDGARIDEVAFHLLQDDQEDQKAQRFLRGDEDEQDQMCIRDRYYGSLCVMIVCAVLFFIRGVRKGLRMAAISALISGVLSGAIWLALRLFATMQDTVLVSACLLYTSRCV